MPLPHVLAVGVHAHPVAGPVVQTALTLPPRLKLPLQSSQLIPASSLQASGAAVELVIIVELDRVLLMMMLLEVTASDEV